MSTVSEAEIWKKRLTALGTVWVKPREAMREHIKMTTSDSYSLFLAVVSTMFMMLVAIYSMWQTGEFSPGIIIFTSAFMLISMTIATIGGFYLGSYILKWIGNRLGGTANFATMRAVMGLGFVSTIASGLISFLFLIIFGEYINSESPNVSYTLLIPVSILEYTISVWGFIIMLVGVAEAHQFSKTKAFLTLLGPTIFFVLLYIFIPILIPA